MRDLVVLLCIKRGHAEIAIQAIKTWVPREGALEQKQGRRIVLLAGGQEFTATGDSQFKKGDALFAYFEVDEPLLVSTPPAKIQVRLRVTNVQTDELKVDTGLQDVSTAARRGKSIVPIAEEVAVDKLPAGSYRLEVQAADSAGNGTQWRAANFTVE